MNYFANDSTTTPPLSNSPLHSSVDMASPNTQQYDWTDVTASEDFVFIEHPQFTAGIESTHGLGLAGLPVTASHASLSIDLQHGRPSTPLPFPWSNVGSFEHSPAAHVQPVRLQQTWMDGSCDPLSTLMPGTLWDASHSIAEQASWYNASPAHSQYSPNSHPSTISTPYARSDSVLRSAASPPQIKIEQAVTPAQIFGNEILQHGLPEQKMTADFDDLISESSEYVEQDTPNTQPPSSSECKISRTRPNRQRALSAEDLLVDRKKRGFTQPDEAKCSCEQCGRFFQRTYNLRAHMETHDPQREQPHICFLQDCTKRFVRRTDLVRHQESVSLHTGTMWPLY